MCVCVFIRRGQAEKFIWWYICCWWLLWPMQSKHCNTNGRSVWTTRTMLKNKLHLVTFHERILVSIWTFHLTLVIQYICRHAVVLCCRHKINHIQGVIGKWSTFKMINFANAFYLFQQTIVSWALSEESSTMMQFTPLEIWKQHAVLLGIQFRSSITKISECLDVNVKTFILMKTKHSVHIIGWSLTMVTLFLSSNMVSRLNIGLHQEAGGGSTTLD